MQIVSNPFFWKKKKLRPFFSGGLVCRMANRKSQNYTPLVKNSGKSSMHVKFTYNQLSQHKKKYLKMCVHSEDSGHQGSKLSSAEQWRLRSVKAKLNFRWAHILEGKFSHQCRIQDDLWRGSIWSNYRTYSMHLEKQSWANSVDLIRVYTVCHSSSNFKHIQK